MVKSLRVVKGQVITASNGNGSLFGVEITSTRGIVKGKLLWRAVVEPEKSEIRLGIGLGRRENLSWLVEKATELGVRSLTPLTTRRSKKPGGPEGPAKLVERLTRVAVSAMKQSKRAYLPSINLPVGLPAFLEQARSHGACLILLDERGPAPTLTRVLGAGAAVRYTILTGPEAGLDEEERNLAVDSGFLPASLGKARLRAETAALAATVAVRAIMDTW